MRIKKWILVVIATLLTTNAAAQEKTYFAAGSIPFKGYYSEKRFRYFNIGFEEGDILAQFILGLPKVFPKGSNVNGISRDGKRTKLTVRKVDTGVLFQGGYILDPPIVYSRKDEKKAVALVWTPGIDIEIVKTERAPIPKKALAELKKRLVREITGAAKSFQAQDAYKKKAALKIAKKHSPPAGRQIAGLKDLVFITWNAGAGHFFIYSLGRKEFLYSKMNLFVPYGDLSGESTKPIFFFRFDNKPDIYILADYFDGYEDRSTLILDARTGATMLSTF